MATRTYSFEGADGAAATTTTAEASTVTAGVTHSAGAALSGNTGLLFTAGTTASIVDLTDFTDTVSPELRIPIWVPTAGFDTEASTFVQIYGGSTGAITIARIQSMLAGSVRLQPLTGATTTLIASLATYYGTWIALGLLLKTGTSTTTGSCEFRLYSDPAAALGSHIGSPVVMTAQNFGSITPTAYPMTIVRVGVGNIPATPPTVMKTDYVQIADTPGASFTLGGVPAATAPTTDAGADVDVDAGTTVTLAGTGTGTGTTTHLWTILEYPVNTTSPTISNATIAAPNVTGIAAGRTVLEYKRTIGALNATDTMTIWARPAANVNASVYSSTSVSWTNEGGATNRRAAYTDTSDVTFGQTPPNPAVTDIDVKVWNPMRAGAIRIVERTRVFRDAGSTNDLEWHYQFLEADGTTLLYTDTWTDTTTTFADHTVIVPDAVNAGLSTIDRRALVTKMWGVPV